ncbi:cobalamin-5'-phosphate synthase [Anaerobacterium chartisolvens]|uniref:Adenosylcobinamide-GDP ribazoletransferase n=1 Tax=Anaerobacterium chartisolvens TaxID=1297424 RepID=A0A369B7R7_9FIRM|nr:adenosylcobinamide-GDP ribazoletransferase [Anaerobacterium chartisolvens]RCX17560.1 cobalamin-5'-phosphate synthase [Anaerobacterium chartisolvens]
MVFLRRFILMLQFLTTIPITVNLKVTEEDMGKGLVFAPIVGLILGGLLAGLHYGLSLIFPPAVCSALLLAAYVMLTGGLHLDGLGDTFDGLFSGRPKERMLEIMRDSRVGTNAVLAIVCVLLINWAVMSGIPASRITWVVLLFPVAGRIGSLTAAGCSRYARSGAGLGKSFIDRCGAWEVALGLAMYMLIFFLAAGYERMPLSVIPPVTSVVLARLLSRKIGGATGDILGAVCELNQSIFLIFAYVLW